MCFMERQGFVVVVVVVVCFLIKNDSQDKIGYKVTSGIL